MAAGNVAYKDNPGQSQRGDFGCHIILIIQSGIDEGAALRLKVLLQKTEQCRVKGFCDQISSGKKKANVFIGYDLGRLRAF